MNTVSPRQIIEQVARAVPSICHENIIIIGSLAAGYQLLPRDSSFQVRTKDIDCVISPRIKAVESGRLVAEQLLLGGWHARKGGDFGKPGTASTPQDKLPAVRLYPPSGGEWFIELLTLPDFDNENGRGWTRLELSTGHYGLPSFRFLPVSTFRPVKTSSGIYCARADMMALANLLEHPSIKPERMAGLFEGRAIRRSNKDLGRVLAIARLSDEEAIARWPAAWEEALRECLQIHWRASAMKVGSGLRALLNSRADLEEAFHTCTNGLLANQGVTLTQLQIAGQRLLQDAIEPLEGRATLAKAA